MYARATLAGSQTPHVARGTQLASIHGVARWKKLLLAAFLVAFAIAGAAYAFRNPLATAAFAYAVDHNQQLSCTHPDVEVTRSLGELIIGPVACDVRGKPLLRVTTTARTFIELGASGPKSIEVGHATFNYRERDISAAHTNTAADIGKIVGMSDSLIKGMLDAAEMYSADTPAISVERLTMMRAGKRESVMYGFWMAVEGTWNRSHAARVDAGIEGLAEIRNFDMRVTPVRGKLSMAVYLGKAERGEAPDTVVRLEGTALDKRQPSFELSLGSREEQHARTR